MIPKDLREQLICELTLLMVDLRNSKSDGTDLDVAACLSALAERTEIDAKRFCHDGLIDAKRNMYGYPSNVIPFKDY